ncbi:alpha/beta fold hydrolase [Aliisedimentitalea scapharcae]|uniref:Alpha/beta fold hydrolase n=1 Tax=Aliisedimentitalea scapharcae TaxID=1524259 RepID=A0ABZ2XW92_9RHOB
MIEPLVLVPGMMCDARIFAHQILHLSRDRAVMVAPITQGETIDDIAMSLLGQLPERFALCGLSMGGIVAMELLRRLPERITRLCLMGTSPLAETPSEAAAREPMLVRVQAGQLADVMRETMRPEFLAPGPQRMEVLNRFWQMGEELGSDLYLRQSRALQRRKDQQATLRKSRVPTLILCGNHDAMVPVRRHEFMSELMPNARLHVLENAGHLPVVETPETVTQVLGQWLSMPTGTV